MAKDLLTLLREGGLILYARHGTATVGVDQANGTFQSCQYQRNLSEQGRQEAVYYGQMLRYWQIPVLSPIIASPFCRTIETAQLAFPNIQVQIDPFLFEIFMLGGNLSTVQQNTILTAFQSMVEMKPPQGINRLIIGHSFPRDVGLGPISSMGTVVIKPKGLGQGYEILGKLTLEDLAKLDTI
ncbi:histidine phosphatase family protein [Lysinibacillus sp. ZYM-1]|uniref:histidine phosphatase family protein n=1 Tax=Lysinibacillus sp. ZYM-1 TaxID=1681184 RepID=UPI0006CE74EB|nr:histidine phosphatase family protein [Lysinibacillus sp. ZYM-1]KPN98114.1 phosphoglycerate mutase [Lysinibacillus sp. ZYM-1]